MRKTYKAPKAKVVKMAPMVILAGSAGKSSDVVSTPTDRWGNAKGANFDEEEEE